MIQLNSTGGQKAWEDYKLFLEGMGMDFSDPRNKALLQQVQAAFKFGFVMGSATPTNETPAPGKTRILTKKRGKIRTPQQIQQDARLVRDILQRKAEPMQLHEITEAVNAAGANWYSKSASGYMAKIVEAEPAVRKVGYGFYAYEQ